MSPDSPETVADELRFIASRNTFGLEGIEPQDTIEWDAAAKLEVASRALREIKDGAPNPKGLAAAALMSISG